MIKGKWQAVIIFNGQQYYNLEKDSFVVYKDYFRSSIVNSEVLDSSLKAEKKMIKELVQANRIQFNDDGSYTDWYGVFGEVSGHYFVDDKAKSIIFFQDGEEKVKDLMKYRLYHNRLEITLGNFAVEDSALTISSPDDENDVNELTIVYKKVNQF